MERKRRSKYCNIAAAAALLAMLAMGCSPSEELCNDPDHPHTGFLDVSFKWIDQKPDSVMMLALRPLNQLKAGFRMCTKAASRNNGRKLFPIEPLSRTDKKTLGVKSNPDGDNVNEYGDPETVPVLHEGVYNLFCYTTNSAGMKDVYGSFRDDPEYRFEDIKVELYPYKDMSVFPGWEDWINHNAYSSYVLPEMPPLCYGYAHDVKVHNGRTTKVTFEANTEATQSVKFNLKIRRKEAGIVIDSVKAEVSGVPSMLNPTTGRVYIEPTYKTVFKFDKPAGGWGRGDMRELTVSRTLHLYGLARGQRGVINGPGVLHVRLYTHVTKDGVTRAKSFQGIISLYQVLGRTPLLRYDKDRDMYFQKVRSATLDLDTPIEITTERVLDSNGVDGWHEIESGIGADI